MSEILKTECVIAGGGLAGLTMTALLAEKGIPSLCIEKSDLKGLAKPAMDMRTTAISYGSHLVLKAAGVWKELEGRACPIKDIRILDGNSPVLLSFLSRDVGDNPFGWIIENYVLRKALIDRIEKSSAAEIKDSNSVFDFDVREDSVQAVLENGERISAKLLIGADGKNSKVRKLLGLRTREWQYSQCAQIAQIAHENPHFFAAYEHFRTEGPFAILPMIDTAKGEHRSAVVWSDHKNPGRSGHMNDITFEAAIRERFPDHYGAIKLLGGRAVYPLSFQHAEHYTGDRVAIIAEAAHVMHPIAGQGLNISLRDVSCLGNLIDQVRKEGGDTGSRKMLETFQRQRRFDTMTMLAATENLNRLFSNGFPPLSLVRKLGIRVVEKLPPAKRFFMKQAMGLR